MFVFVLLKDIKHLFYGRGAMGHRIILFHESQAMAEEE